MVIVESGPTWLFKCFCFLIMSLALSGRDIRSSLLFIQLWRDCEEIYNQRVPNTCHYKSFSDFILFAFNNSLIFASCMKGGLMRSASFLQLCFLLASWTFYFCLQIWLVRMSTKKICFCSQSWLEILWLHHILFLMSLILPRSHRVSNFGTRKVAGRQSR